MASHQRTMPLLRLLARLRWQRDRNLWTVRYEDEHGRRARIFVHLSPTGISITVSSPGTVALTPCQAGLLRLALRDAVLRFGELAGLQEPGGWACAAAPEPAPPLPAGPSVRERVRFRPPPARPTVAQIAQRLADSAAAERMITITMPTARYPAPEQLGDLAAARVCQPVARP